MKVIGIVGGMGAGKSTVTRMMNEIEPVAFIDADQIGHDILLKGHEAYDAVIHYFDREILDEKGEIVRRLLGNVVFADPKKVQVLNEITHPIITKLIKEQIARYKETQPTKHIILEAALLLESGLVDLTDVVVAIYAKKEIRLERVRLRDGLEDKQILERFARQKKWQEIEAAADFVIDNGISIENTKAQIKALFEKL